MILRDHSSFGLPASARFFFSEDAGGGTGTATTDAGAGGDPDGGGDSAAGALDDFSPSDGKASPAQERVEGEKAPDFGKLFSKKPAEAAPEALDGTKGAPKEEKPAGGADTSGKKPSEAPGKTPKTPAKADAPPKAPETSPKKPAAAPAKAQEPPKVEKKEGEAPKIPTDEEIDALQPKPGAPTRIIEDFGKMRARLKEMATTARAAIADKEALAKEAETLRASSGKLPEDVEKELSGLRNFHMLFNAQQDPVFQREFDGKIQQSEEAIYSLLTKHGLKEEVIKSIKDAATANGGNIEAWTHWPALIDAFTNPLDKQAAINALQARREAIAGKTAKLDQLAKDREGYFKTLQEKDSVEKKKWSKELETRAIEISTGEDWAEEKEILETDTPEIKRAKEEHNAEVTKIAETFKTNVLGAYNRDPKITADLAFAGVKSEQLTKQLAAETAKLAKAEKRVEELEQQIAKIKGAGRMAHIDSPGADTGKSSSTVEEGKIGGDGSAAITKFFSRK